MTQEDEKRDKVLTEYVESGLDRAAVINLNRIRENISTLREQMNSETKLLFAVKTDGYGHGLIPTAQAAALEEVDYLGVSTIAEGVQLRTNGLKLPVLVFNPPRNPQVEEATRHDLTVTVTGLRHFREVKRHLAETGKPLKCQIIVDTGMGRLGIEPEIAPQLAQQVTKADKTLLTGIYSHLSSADSDKEEDKAFTQNQIHSFREVLEDLKSEDLLPPLRHISNSASFLRYTREVSEKPFNMVRCGTLLYGYPEVHTPWSDTLKPALRAFSRIIDIRNLPAGRYVSYGRTYQCPEPTTTAVLPFGYGHGLDRRLSNKGKVRVGETVVPIIGKICSDKTIIDVTDAETAIGDPVEIMGIDPSAQDQARAIGADVVEVTTSLSVPRLYPNGEVCT